MREVRSPWLTVKEAARYLRTSDANLRHLVDAGQIPAHPRPFCENRVLFHTGELDEYLLQRAVEPCAGARADLVCEVAGRLGKAVA